MNQRISEFQRFLNLELPVNPLKGSGALFLWGPRQTGKTTLLKQQFKDAFFFDLLDTTLAAEFSVQPSSFREQVLALEQNTIVIDEVQKVPLLLDEVHWLLENTEKKIILCGSSARKLKREARNLLGGRAIDYYLYPLVSVEVPNFDLDRLLNHGGVPIHYLSPSSPKLLKAYVNNYIKEEILEESLTRNIPAFARFLQIVGLTHGQLLNYANVAREAGVSASTVRNYYQILLDTLLGFELQPWRKKKNRRLVETAKFYLFDVALAHCLNPDITEVVPGSSSYGQAFEHFLLNEIRAYLSYHDLYYPLSFWRTSSGFEVDLILGNMDFSIEFKSSTKILAKDLKGTRTLKEEHKVRRSLIICREQKRRATEDGIEIMHWQEFCSLLWKGDLFNRSL